LKDQAFVFFTLIHCSSLFNMLSKTAVLLAAIIPSVLGQNANTTATSDVGSSSAFSPTPVTTAVPSATAALNAPVPGQGEYPPLQGEPARSGWYS
jgi:hypothetical protein